jgi:Ca2+-binding EF-hand superfamily protein
MDNISVARTQFRSIDMNGNGSLDLGELSNGLSDFGLTDAEIEAIFVELEVNNDGRVSEEEYVAGYTTSRPDDKTAHHEMAETDEQGMPVD